MGIGVEVGLLLGAIVEVVLRQEVIEVVVGIKINLLEEVGKVGIRILGEGEVIGIGDFRRLDLDQGMKEKTISGMNRMVGGRQDRELWILISRMELEGVDLSGKREVEMVLEVETVMGIEGEEVVGEGEIGVDGKDHLNNPTILFNLNPTTTTASIPLLQGNVAGITLTLLLPLLRYHPQLLKTVVSTNSVERKDLKKKMHQILHRDFRDLVEILLRLHRTPQCQLELPLRRHRRQQQQYRSILDHQELLNRFQLCLNRSQRWL